jgi:hypothetical protein
LGYLTLASPWFQAPLLAQVFEVGGGTSTLYQATGGGVTVRAKTYDLTIGAGIIDGHILGGAQMVKATPHATYILGDDRISFSLPTDVFDVSHFFFARGIGVRATRGQNDMLAFVGATTTDYNSPLFDGAKTNQAAGVFFLRRTLSSHLQLFSDSIISNKLTAIEAIQWTPRPKLDLAVAAGLGANQPYGAVSLSYSRPWIDAQAAYIQAGSQFHRVALVSPLLAEPDRANVLVTLRPFGFLSITGAHQDFLVPQYPTMNNVRSSVDQASTGLRILGASLNASLYKSSYQDSSNHAVSLSATRDFTERFHVMANYLASRPKDSAPTNSFISTFSEAITSRLSVDETVTTSGGQTGITFGGQLLSNLMSVGAGYQTFYVPADNKTPFQQVLVANATVNVSGHITLHGESFVDPTGHLRYTLSVHSLMWHGQNSGPLTEHVEMERAIMRGCVLDENGDQIEGAALLIDKKLVYTDSSGCFFLRERRPHTHSLQIVLTLFLAGGNWHVISAPSTITSTPDSDKKEIPIVVVLTKVRVVSAIPTAAGVSTR